MDNQMEYYRELSETMQSNCHLIYGSLDEELPTNVLQEVLELCHGMSFKEIEGHKHSMTFSAQEQINEYLYDNIKNTKLSFFKRL